jgi:hypothetical protein
LTPLILAFCYRQSLVACRNYLDWGEIIMSDNAIAHTDAEHLIGLAGKVQMGSRDESVAAQDRFSQEWASISKDPVLLNQVKEELNKFAAAAAPSQCAAFAEAGSCPTDVESAYGIKIDAQNQASVSFDRPSFEWTKPVLANEPAPIEFTKSVFANEPAPIELTKPIFANEPSRIDFTKPFSAPEPAQIEFTHSVLK